MAATEGSPSFALMLTDQLQDSPRERSALVRELERMKFSEVSEDFNNIVLQNQPPIMAATEAAKSAAYTVNQLSEIFKAVLPAMVPPRRKSRSRSYAGWPAATTSTSTEHHSVSTGENNVNRYGPTRCPNSYRRSWNERLIFFANNSDICIVQRNLQRKQ